MQPVDLAHLVHGCAPSSIALQHASSVHAVAPAAVLPPAVDALVVESPEPATAVVVEPASVPLVGTGADVVVPASDVVVDADGVVVVDCAFTIAATKSIARGTIIFQAVSTQCEKTVFFVHVFFFW